MIKANELRLGSWLQFKDPCVVRGIPDTLYGTVNMLYGNVISVHCESNGTFYDSSAIKVDLQPIILTEELLLKCGFKMATDHYGGYLSPNRNGSSIRLCGSDGQFIYNINQFDECYIRSLHQLQNWYFALTGQELEITL